MSVRNTGGIHSWVLQRISALYIVLFCCYSLIYWFIHTPLTYQNWCLWLASDMVNISSVTFCWFILLHAWVGLRDIATDYISGYLLRFAVLNIFALFFLGMGIWATKILLVLV